MSRTPQVGLLRRLGAIFYDALLLAAVLFFALLPIVWLHGEALWSERAPYSITVRLYLLAVSFLYFGWCWTHGGQTPGMRAWRCYLVTSAGARVGWGRAAVRFLLAIASWLPLGIGFLWSLAHRERLAWHDTLSGTRLLRTRY